MIEKKQCTMVIVRLAVSGIGFLLLPLFFHIYFLKAYYVFCSAIMFIGTVKHLVCLNRERLREQPYLLNVVREGLLFTTFIVTSFFAIAVFSRGYSPAELLQLITPTRLVLMLLALVAVCLGSGALIYSRKKKRFRGIS